MANPYILPRPGPPPPGGGGRWAMPSGPRVIILAAVLVAAAPLVVALLLDPTSLHAEHGLLSQGEGLGWDRPLLWLHVGTDLLTGLAYVLISAMLIRFAHRAGRKIPFLWAFVAFGTFIVACGLTHFLAAVTVWEPAYWVAGGVKYVTAAVSVGTALAVPPLVPKALALVEAARVSEERRWQLEASNGELAALSERLREADELKTRFFANVSHELRTPLALILGPVARLRAEDGLSADQRRDLDAVERNARLLLRHVNDLLDVAKLDAGKLGARYAQVDFARLVRRAAAHFEPLAQERGIDFRVEAPVSLRTQVDPEQVRRVVVNLLANAFRFAPDGGIVRCVLRADGARATIDVEDSGPGVPPELRAVVFDRFRQAEDAASWGAGGSGLGLAIAKEFVELHGGAITVGDAAAGGALFRVELPLTAPAGTSVRTEAAATDEPIFPLVTAVAEPSRDAEQVTPVATEGGRPLVLVVEDHPELRRFVGEVLAPDHRVVAAADGAAALARARADRPDLIVTDVMMAGMGGDELIRTLKTDPDLADIPVIVLSARADDELRVRLLREGVQDYLVKPFAPEELRARVGNLLAMTRARDVLRRELRSREGNVATLANELAAALRARDEFLSVAAHELRTPVTVVKGMAHHLVREQERGRFDPDRIMRQAGSIAEAGDRLAALTDNLLDVSRLRLGRLPVRPERLDLAALAREAVERYRNGTVAGHRLKVDAPDRPCWVLADPERIDQVLTNLIDNAVKYSPDGGEVVVRVRGEGEGVELAVADHGIGLPPGAEQLVFEPFGRAANAEQRHLPGLGLGLAICRGIVERHGGRIRAESAGEGRGTTVSVWLPDADEAVLAADSSEPVPLAG